MQLANLVYGVKRFETLKKPVKLLVIDNKPDRFMADIDSRLDGLFKGNIALSDVLAAMTPIIHTFYKTDGFLELYENVKADGNKCEVFVNSPDGSAQKSKLEEFDFILVDMCLEDKHFDGLDFIKLLANKAPAIPVFMMSVSDDIRTVHSAFQEGGEYYIFKSQILSLPLIYWAYMDDIGSLCQALVDDAERKSIIGNIRYWKFKKDFLWFGDKCYHMINHSYEHTLHDWQNLSRIVSPLMEEFNKKEGYAVAEQWLYPLCMAAWLHDIGHKGNERYGAPFQIRDAHGYISAEYVLKHPKLLGIVEDNGDVDDYYNNVRFHPGTPGSAMEILYYRRKGKKELSNAEKIALICAFHSSNAPLDVGEYNRLLSKKSKRIPRDFYLEGIESAKTILTAEKILAEIYEANPKEVNAILSLIALFRVVDALDIHQSRVGDNTEKDFKIRVMDNDKECEFGNIEREVRILADVYCKDPAQKALFIQRYYEDLKGDIEQGKVIDFKSLEKLISDDKQSEFENYLMRTYYTSFISVQHTHFDLHGAISELLVDYLGNSSFRFTLLTNRDVKWLKDNKVKERGKDEQSVFDRLIGMESCYIKKELDEAANYIRHVVNKVDIVLVNNSGVQLGEKVTWLANKAR